MMLKRHFKSIICELDFYREEKPVLLIANHFSWWDGFIGNYLSYNYFRKRFHVMMLREQLARRMFLNKAGAYSVEKSSRSLIESLQYSAEILSHRDNMVMMFPQGNIESIYHRGFHFEKGIEKILARCKDSPEIVLNINLVDYFSNQKPTLFIRTKTYTGEYSAKKIEEAFNRFHMECVDKQRKDLV